MRSATRPASGSAPSIRSTTCALHLVWLLHRSCPTCVDDDQRLQVLGTSPRDHDLREAWCWHRCCPAWRSRRTSPVGRRRKGLFPRSAPPTGQLDTRTGPGTAGPRPPARSRRVSIPLITAQTIRLLGHLRWLSPAHWAWSCRAAGALGNRPDEHDGDLGCASTPPGPRSSFVARSSSTPARSWCSSSSPR